MYSIAPFTVLNFYFTISKKVRRHGPLFIEGKLKSVLTIDICFLFSRNFPQPNLPLAEANLANSTLKGSVLDSFVPRVNRGACPPHSVAHY